MNSESTCTLVLTRQMVETDWVDTLRDADPPRCKVCLVAVAPPHNRCLSADWPNHHHVFGALP